MPVATNDVLCNKDINLQLFNACLGLLQLAETFSVLEETCSGELHVVNVLVSLDAWLILLASTVCLIFSINLLSEIF